MVIVLTRRRAQKSQAKRLVGWLVPSVLAVAQDSNPIATTRGTVVGPLMSAHLILILCTDAARDSAKGDIVGIILIGEGEREVDLQHALVGMPVNFVDALHAVVDGIHADVLYEGRSFLLTLDTKRLTQWAILYKFYLGIARNVGRRRAANVGVTDFPSRPSVLVVVDKLLLHSGIDERTIILKVIEIGDVAI